MRGRVGGPVEDLVRAWHGDLVKDSHGARVDIVVIGAGQLGLAVARHLQRAGLTRGAGIVGGYVVLDDGLAPGGAWQHQRDAVRMGKAHGVPDLPGMAAPGDPDERASVAVPRYLGAYERAFELPVVRPVRVRAVRDVGGPGGLLAVETDRGEWLTRAVVSAAGSWQRPFWPAYPGCGTFAGLQVHARDVRSAVDFSGRHVVLVGGGTSALALRGEIAEATTMTWVTRRPEPGDQASERREIDVGVLAPLPMFARIVPDGVVWDPRDVPPAPAHREAGVLVWATGFRADLNHLAPLRLRAHGGGIVTDGTQVVADPRVQVVGYPLAGVPENRAPREAVRNLRRLLAF
jgi:thioredoxin reductase